MEFEIVGRKSILSEGGALFHKNTELPLFFLWWHTGSTLAYNHLIASWQHDIGFIKNLLEYLYLVAVTFIFKKSSDQFRSISDQTVRE